MHCMPHAHRMCMWTPFAHRRAAPSLEAVLVAARGSPLHCLLDAIAAVTLHPRHTHPPRRAAPVARRGSAPLRSSFIVASLVLAFTTLRKHTLRAQHAHAACTPFAHRRAPRDALAETHLATRLTAASFALSPATLCVRRVYGASQARGAHAALHDACAARARRTCRPRAQRVRTLRVQRAHAARVPWARRMPPFAHRRAPGPPCCSLLL